MRRPLTYDAVGAGMAVYARTVHRSTAIDADRLRLVPGTILVSAHLSDADVPVIAGTLFGRLRLWRDPGAARPAFAVRNDLLEPGFLAGYPPRLPRALRRALFRLDVGPILRERLRCLPLRRADRLQVVEALRARPDVELAGALPADLLLALAARAARSGRPAPVLARDALDGVYADLLWTVVTRERLDGPAWEGVWSERLARAGADLGALLRHLDDGGALVLFPHGEVSADGSIEPLEPRAGRLLRHARAAVVQPVGVAYDPLVAGRPRAFVGVGAPLGALPRSGAHHLVTAALRAATPLTCGLVLARAIVADGRTPSCAGALAMVESAARRAVERGRPLEPALRAPRRRRARVEQALRAARRLGPGHPALRRAARTAAAAEGGAET